MKGVYPLSFHGQLISFHLGAINLCFATYKKSNVISDCNEKKNSTFPDGWIIKMLFLGEIKGSHLLIGISTRNISFIKKKEKCGCL